MPKHNDSEKGVEIEFIGQLNKIKGIKKKLRDEFIKSFKIIDGLEKKLADRYLNYWVEKHKIDRLFESHVSLIAQLMDPYFIPSLD